MLPNLQYPADLVTFIEEILNGKLHFLCSGRSTFKSLTSTFTRTILSWTIEDKEASSSDNSD